MKLYFSAYVFKSDKYLYLTSFNGYKGFLIEDNNFKRFLDIKEHFKGCLVFGDNSEAIIDSISTSVLKKEITYGEITAVFSLYELRLSGSGTLLLNYNKSYYECINLYAYEGYNDIKIAYMDFDDGLKELLMNYMKNNGIISKETTHQDLVDYFKKQDLISRKELDEIINRIIEEDDGDNSEQIEDDTTVDNNLELPMGRKPYPFPQANDLDKLLTLTDEIIKKGSIKKSEIAEMFGFSSRQADYYANALGFLGFADIVNQNVFPSDFVKNNLINSNDTKKRLIERQ